MTDRVLILLGVAIVGTLLLLAFRWYRGRAGAMPDRLDIDALDLELMTGCCAFIVFTTPTCRPCKAVLQVVGAAARERPGLTEVRTVDALQRSELAVRYDIRTVPTTFLITASGHVVRRWRDVPQRRDVEAALSLL